MREVRLDEWRRQKEMRPRRAPEPGESAHHAVRRRPSTPEQLTNSILYIRLKMAALDRDRRLCRVGPRRWRMAPRRR